MFSICWPGGCKMLPVKFQSWRKSVLTSPGFPLPRQVGTSSVRGLERLNHKGLIKRNQFQPGQLFFQTLIILNTFASTGWGNCLFIIIIHAQVEHYIMYIPIWQVLSLLLTLITNGFIVYLISVPKEHGRILNIFEISLNIVLKNWTSKLFKIGIK